MLHQPSTTRESCTIVRSVGFAALLAGLSWLVAGLVVAAEPPAAWQCTQCAPATGWVVDLGLAPAYVGDDAYRFGDYTGLDEQGGYLFGELAGSYRGTGGKYFRVDGFSLNPDFSAIDLEGGRQGRFEIRATYQSIPRRFYATTTTPFQAGGSATQTLPAGWVRAPVTSGMSELADAARPVEIGRDWDVLKLGFDLRPERRWKISTDYSRRVRKGKGLSSGSFLFSATELATPIDYTSDDLEVAVSYAADAWQGSLSYRGAYFDNGDSSLTWDNPFTGVPGADAGSIAAAPDNRSHQLVLAGALRLPKRTVLSGQVAVGRVSQDEDLLPYTLNPGIATAPLPLRSADAEADTTRANFRAVASPTRRLTVEAEVRYHEFDNKKPVSTFDYVITDSVPTPSGVRNLAYDYERTDLKLRGELRPGRRLKLQLGFDTRRFERSFSERSTTTTDKVWFRLRHRLGDGADLDFDLFTEQRHGSSYEVRDDPAAQQNPLMRKYNLSDRDRYGIRLNGTVYPSSIWDFGWTLEYGEDDYDQTSVGLTSTRYARAGLDASVVVGRRGSLYAAVHTEHVEAEQASSQSFSAPDWTATTSDDFDTASIGFEHPELLGPVGLRLEYDWSRSRGRTSNDTSGLRSRFPDLESRRETIRLGLDYRLDDRWSFALDYLHERIDSDDWALDGLEPATVPNFVSLGADPFNYRVNLVYFTVRYQR